MSGADEKPHARVLTPSLVRAHAIPLDVESRAIARLLEVEVFPADLPRERRLPRLAGAHHDDGGVSGESILESAAESPLDHGSGRS
jgi:hypothetical protein